MNQPHTLWVPTGEGTFRVLEWEGGRGAPAFFLHGLTGVADVWGPTIGALRARPGCYATDQRGHGHSPKPPTGYAIADYVRDAAQLIEELDIGPVRLVGHSMGARVAMVLAARKPHLVQSAAIVDIGPEAWRENWESTVAGLDRLPESYESVEAAIGNAGRARGGESIDAVRSTALREIAEARLRVDEDGRVRWLASREALKQTVISHRSRHFWREWAAIDVPALFIRGGESKEVRPAIAQRMRETNPRVSYEEFEGVGHNIPLLAPERLAATLSAFWRSAEAVRT